MSLLLKVRFMQSAISTTLSISYYFDLSNTSAEVGPEWSSGSLENTCIYSRMYSLNNLETVSEIYFDISLI